MRQIPIALALALALAAPAQAQDAPAPAGLDYDYLEGGLLFGDYDGPDSLGLGLRGSYRLPGLPKLRLLAGVAVHDLDEPDGEAYDLLVGAGVIVPLQPRLTDLVVDFGLLHSAYDLDPPGARSVDDDDTGVRLAGYVRHRLAEGLQIEGGLNYVDLFNDDDLGLNLGLYYDIAPRATLLLRFDDEAGRELLGVGLRYSY